MTSERIIEIKENIRFAIVYNWAKIVVLIPNRKTRYFIDDRLSEPYFKTNNLFYFPNPLIILIFPNKFIFVELCGLSSWATMSINWVKMVQYLTKLGIGSHQVSLTCLERQILLLMLYPIVYGSHFWYWLVQATQIKGHIFVLT